MRRVWILLFCLLGPRLLTGALQGAEQDDIDARFARVNSAVEQLLASNVALQKRIDHLEEEIAAAREEQSRTATNTAVVEDLRKLAEDLRAVDRKREEDKELILKELDKLGKSLAAGGSSRTAPPPVATSTDQPSGKAYQYTVKPGDNLDDIVAFYNKQFKDEHRQRLTLQQVLEANPALKKHPDRVVVGKTILIPQPPLQKRADRPPDETP